MASYRYESKAESALRDSKQRLWVHIAVGLFVCLTIIGIPIGLIMICVGFSEYNKSVRAIAQYRQAESGRIRDANRDAMIRAMRSFR